MDIVNYLTQIYGYNAPIFLKDIRIGRKSKSAIKEEFYRATKRGEIVRKSNGIYYVKGNNEFGSGITFEEIIQKKYLYKDDVAIGFEELFVEGYYSGLTFLNQIGISEQVPAVLEVTTNKTSSKKRYYSSGKRIAIIRKSRTEINFQNYKILQFLDMFYFVSMDEVKKNKELLRTYIKDNCLTRSQFTKYIGFYGTQTIKKIVEGGIIDAFI